MKLHLIVSLLALSAYKSVETTTCVSAPSITSVLSKNIAFTYDQDTSIDIIPLFIT